MLALGACGPRYRALVHRSRASRTALREELCDAGSQQRSLDPDRLRTLAGQIGGAVATFEATTADESYTAAAGSAAGESGGGDTPGRYSAEVGALLAAVRSFGQLLLTGVPGSGHQEFAALYQACDSVRSALRKVGVTISDS